jgi:putative thioredoxin
MMQVATSNVVDVTDDTFEEVVIEGSKERPVVVDLWASWCAPCRTLGPILEKVAEERKGAFLLAKVDVDAQGVGQALLQAVRSQGIPTVVGFRDGAAVDVFIGAYPEPEVNRFVDGLLPTDADLGAREALEEEEEGDLEDAEAKYREALDTDANNRTARLGLGRILAQQGAATEARQTLMPLLPDADAEKLLAEIEVASWASVAEPGTLASAKRLAAQGKWREALDGMLGALRDDPDARQAMLEVFSVLGEQDELVFEYRRKMANALF